MSDPDSRPREQVTELLGRWRDGDEAAAEDLLARVHGELRRLARAQLRRRPSASLQPTELVAEAYLKLIGSAEPEWDSRVHFYSVAARAMRQLLIDRYRRRKAQRRGGAESMITLKEPILGAPGKPVELDRLEDALSELEALDPRQGEIVTLKFYGGLTVEEIGAVLDLSPRTVKREWAAAKLWLYRELKRD